MMNARVRLCSLLLALFAGAGTSRAVDDISLFPRPPCDIPKAAAQLRTFLTGNVRPLYDGDLPWGEVFKVWINLDRGTYIEITQEPTATKSEHDLGAVRVTFRSLCSGDVAHGQGDILAQGVHALTASDRSRKFVALSLQNERLSATRLHVVLMPLPAAMGGQLQIVLADLDARGPGTDPRIEWFFAEKP